MNAIVIIPVYQPELCLEQLVNELWQNGNQVIVVDDGSQADQQWCFEVISQKAIILHHEKNMGKGAAIKTALKYIEEDLWEYDIVGIMDGDGQHLVADMEKLIFKARQYRRHLILGVRKFGHSTPLRSKLGNMITKKVFHMTTGVEVSDTQSGLRAFTRDMIQRFGAIDGERYEYETRVLMTCAKERIPIKEVEIETIYNDKSNSCSHFHTIRDSWRIYKEIIKFSSVSLSSFVLDYMLFSLFYFMSGRNVAFLFLVNVMARICSGTYNYLMNTKVVFRKNVTFQSAGEYIVLATCMIFLNNVFLQGYVRLIHSVAIAKILTELSLFILSFLVQKFGIYSNKKGNLSEQRKEQTKHEKIYHHSGM